MTGEVRWTSLESAEDVTEEILEIVREKVDGWYDEGNIDWEDVWYRAEGTELADGSKLDLGGDLMSPYLKYIKKMILQERRS